MNYPLDSLVYIAPILFIVMMVAFPVIGVFGGWKRAAYWGGGNFIFYIIGMIIWITCNQAMSGSVVGLIKGIIGQKFDGDLSKIAASVLAPIYFIGVVFISNIILVINYYAWFKRVAGLSKYKTVKKTSSKGVVTKSKVQVQHNYSTKYKVMNMVVGGVGMGVLMLPTTFASTNALFFTTTSYKTRAKNKFAAGVYAATVGSDYTIDWLSYYSNANDTAKDFDALFAALDMYKVKVDFIPPGGSAEDVKHETLMEALADTFNVGLGNINGSTMDYKDPADRVTIVNAVNNITDSWNWLIDQAGPAMSALFNSDNATEVVSDFVANMASSSLSDDLKITEENIKNYLGDPDTGYEGIFKTLLKEYQNDPQGEGQGEFHDIQHIDVTQKAYDNMVNAISNLYQWQETEDFKKEDYIGAFSECMNDLLGLLFC